jgi:hypothetical protein
MKWDLFLSHASEDKRQFVEPLALKLVKAGYRVWYDRLSLRAGDILRRSVDEGLAESAVGVVVLSPNFFLKEWAQRELDALTTQQITSGKPLVPIWWHVTKADVARKSPLLASVLAIDGARGLDHVLSELKGLINATDKCTDREVDDIIARCLNADPDNQRFLERRSLSNFSKLVSYYNAYERRIGEVVDQCEGKDDDELAEEADRLMQPWLEDALRQFDIPPQVYLQPVREITQDDAEAFENRLRGWCNGTLGQDGSAELLYDMEEWLDADFLFVLFGVPNFRVSPAQREVLCQAIIDVGARSLKEASVPWSKLYRRVLGARRRRATNRIS